MFGNFFEVESVEEFNSGGESENTGVVLSAGFKSGGTGEEFSGFAGQIFDGAAAEEERPKIFNIFSEKDADAGRTADFRRRESGKVGAESFDVKAIMKKSLSNIQADEKPMFFGLVD